MAMPFKICLGMCDNPRGIKEIVAYLWACSISYNVVESLPVLKNVADL